MDVSLVAAAVCPHPPMIVPEIAGAAAPELDDLRVACDAAVSRLLASGAESLVVVGADHRTADLSPPYRGSFAGWGAAVEMALGEPPGGAVGTPRLPLSLLVGGWLLGRVPGARRPLGYRMVTIGRDEPVERCAAAGSGVGSSRPWALLVMGDGSACRGEKSPGYDDPRAQAYDERVAAALATADTEALLNLDPVLSAELKVAGRAPWQVLAAAARASGAAWRGDLSYSGAPYGVSYFVAGWSCG